MKMKSKHTLLLSAAFIFSNKSFAIDETSYHLLSDPGTLLASVFLALLLAVMFILPNVIETLLKLVKRHKGKAMLILGLLATSAAKAEMIGPDFYRKFDGYHFVLVLAVFILILAISTQLRIINRLAKELRETNALGEKSETAWSRFIKKMTDAKEISEEKDILLDHDYDGIKELDNNLPPWWLYGFYITIIFAVVYMGHYHVFNTGDLMIAEYEKEMLFAQEELKAKAASGDIVLLDENNVELLTDAASLDKGAKLYTSLCAACHAAEGQGLVGPNLTDAYWVHGGSFKDVFSVIKYGVPEKGMIPWKTQLSPTQMQNVASYIMTLQGTNPPNPKAPEGDLHE